MSPAPEEVVQRQLDAYNARNLEAWLGTYAPDAQQFALHGNPLQDITVTQHVNWVMLGGRVIKDQRGGRPATEN